MATQATLADNRTEGRSNLCLSPNLQPLLPVHTRQGSVINLYSNDPTHGVGRSHTDAQRNGLFGFKMANALRILEGEEAKIKDGRFDKLNVVEKLEEHPRGYPRLAAFVNSDVDNVMFRSFGYLHARSLLYKQAELTELETQLQELDTADDNDKASQWKLQSHINLSKGDNKLRKDLMEKIDMKMKDFDELLLRDHQLRNLRKASKRLHRNLFNYIFNRKPITKKDASFIYHKDDFVCLVDHVEFNWLDDAFHKIMYYGSGGLLRVGDLGLSNICEVFRICVTKEDRERTTDKFIHYYSHSRVRTVLSFLIASLSTMLLLIPVYILITIPMDVRTMTTVVLGFVFLFSALLSVFTDARRQDIFAATAAYSAVLVVFLSNLQQGANLVPR